MSNSSNAEQLEAHIKATIDDFLQHVGNWENAKLHGLLLPMIEQSMIQHVYEKCGGNLSRTAKVLGLSRTTVRQKLALK